MHQQQLSSPAPEQPDEPAHEPSQPRPLKRSQRVVLTTLAMAGVASVQACGSSDWGEEPSVDASPFASVEDCARSGQIPQSTCQEAYNEALARHEGSAPRFESQPLCEEEFGAGRCQQRVTGSGGIWMPVLAGFMVGRMLDRQNRYYYRYGPLYHSYRSGGWYSGGPYGGPLYNSGNGWRAGASAFERSSASPPVRTRASVSSRGGFGGRSRSGGG
jgi:uncharacterized protein YgiB involved in biofilm formation